MTPKQIALIHVAKKRLGLTEDQYRALLLWAGGVESAKDLDAAGFERVMGHLTSWGFKSDWNRRTFGNRPGMASPRQVDLIRDLWRQFSGADDDAALGKWLERSYKVSSLRFVDAAAAQKAITGLRAMTRRKVARAG
ncbi:MAG: regulatory protein GemA [Bacteroidales bacterium]|nr:regulatory protein GemA [Candidatus Methylacidiphilales bacterium]NJO54010.1 regulatory protein GemA [Bacteroidales bacterium]